MKISDIIYINRDFDSVPFELNYFADELKLSRYEWPEQDSLKAYPIPQEYMLGNALAFFLDGEFVCITKKYSYTLFDFLDDVEFFWIENKIDSVISFMNSLYDDDYLDANFITLDTHIEDLI